MLDKLHEVGTRRNDLLHRHKEAVDENLPAAQRVRTYAAAKKAVEEWARLTDPEKLMPYLVSLAYDAARYQHIRNELTRDQRQALSDLSGKELDAHLDALREEWFAASNTPELPLELKTHDGTTINRASKPFYSALTGESTP